MHRWNLCVSFFYQDSQNSNCYIYTISYSFPLVPKIWLIQATFSVIIHGIRYGKIAVDADAYQNISVLINSAGKPHLNKNASASQLEAISKYPVNQHKFNMDFISP